MSTDEELPGTADGVRRYNRELDDALRELFDRVDESSMHERPDPDEWTVAENLGHIAEFPGYFSRQLAEWIAGERTVIGRVAEHDADRNDAIVRASSKTLAQLRDEAEHSFAALEHALEGLTDAHLTTDTHNVKYGTEPLTAFLKRYVVGHKAAHVRQLRETLERVSAA